MRSHLKPGLLRSQSIAAGKSLTLIVIGATTWAMLTVPMGLSQQPSSDATGTGASAQTVSRPTLKPGSQGNEVTELQSTLKLLGFYGGMVDGVYGQTTVSAVYTFQQAAGIDADGIVGPATWGRLFPPAPVITASAAPSSTAATRPVAAKPTDLPNVAAAAAPAPASSAKPMGSPTAAPKPTGAKPAAGTAPVASPAPSPTMIAAVKKPSPPATTGSSMPSAAPASSLEAAFPVLRLGMKGSAVSGLQHRLRAIGLLKGGADGVFGNETQEAVKAAQRKFKLDADGVVGPATWVELMQ